jgi:hypothetical protein
MPFVISWVLVSGRRGPLIELYDHWEHAASINELSLALNGLRKMKGMEPVNITE